MTTENTEILSVTETWKNTEYIIKIFQTSDASFDVMAFKEGIQVSGTYTLSFPDYFVVMGFTEKSFNHLIEQVKEDIQKGRIMDDSQAVS